MTGPALPNQVEQVAKRTESRLRAWWSAWKYVAILALALVLSLWGNLHQYGTQRSAKATCRANMVEAARKGIELERERAANDEKQARKIADESKQEAAADARGAQESTHGREAEIRNVVVRGDCRMPAGLPRLQPAVDEANAAARF